MVVPACRGQAANKAQSSGKQKHTRLCCEAIPPKIRRSMSSNSSRIVIRPARNLLGALRLPGDKSISHRYAMLGGIAEGTTRLENFSTGADCASTLGCLRTLGVQWERN